MPIDMAMSVMSLAEFVLWVTLGILFWRKRLHLRFPAMNAYLVLRVVSAPALLTALYLQSKPWGREFYPVYFYMDWAGGGVGGSSF